MDKERKKCHTSTDDNGIGSLAETAIFSQWFHCDATLYYARWDKGSDKGEVDLVRLSTSTQKLAWAVEVKWSDRYCENLGELSGLIGFCHKNKLKSVLVTSRSRTLNCQEHNIDFEFLPASIYCYSVGYNLIHSKDTEWFK